MSTFQGSTVFYMMKQCRLIGSWGGGGGLGLGFFLGGDLREEWGEGTLN